MSYFLRELVPRDISPSTSSAPSPSQLVSEQYAQLIQKYYPVRTKGSILRIPTSKETEESQRGKAGFSPILVAFPIFYSKNSISTIKSEKSASFSLILVVNVACKGRERDCNYYQAALNWHATQGDALNGWHVFGRCHNWLPLSGAFLPRNVAHIND